MNGSNRIKYLAWAVAQTTAALAVAVNLLISTPAGADNLQLAQGSGDSLRLHRGDEAPAATQNPSRRGGVFELGAQKTDLYGADQRSTTPLPFTPLVPKTGVIPGQVQSDALQGQTGQFGLGAFQNAPRPLKAQTAIADLKNYDLELIIDRSASMHYTDTPGGVTRWQWVAGQTNAFESAVDTFYPQGINVSTFATDARFYPHMTPRDMMNLMAVQDLQLGTMLAKPLDDRLQNYFRNRRPGSKPLLIVIITDGEPSPIETEPRKVINTLISATYQMKNPDEVTIVFFRIGSGAVFGANYLRRITNLQDEGAKYNIVKVVGFAQLKQEGLAQALVNTLTEFDARTGIQR